MFVDSDDWVDDEFCRVPYEAALDNNADMIVFRSYKAKKRDKSFRCGVVDEEEALKFSGWVVWNKLYKTELFEKIRFPEGKLFEDISTTHRIIHVAKRIFCIDNKLYHYVYRKDSISHTYSITARKERFIAVSDWHDNMVRYGCSTKASMNLLHSTSIGLISAMKPCDDEIYLKARKVVDSITGIPKSLPYKQKIVLAAWKGDKRLFFFLLGVRDYLSVIPRIRETIHVLFTNKYE